jgi:hypothetical protein
MSELPYSEGDFITLTGTVGHAGTGNDLPNFKKGANYDGRVNDYTLFVESIETPDRIADVSTPERIVVLRKPDGNLTEVRANTLRSHTISQKNSSGYQTQWTFLVKDE